MIKSVKDTRIIFSFVIAVVLFFYWFYPVYQDQHYWNYLERTYDFEGLLTIPVTLLHSIGIASYSLAVGVLIIGFLFSWISLSLIAMEIFKNINRQKGAP